MKSPITAYRSPTMVLHPFGMITLGRSWDVGSEYRYGFNGNERVDEIAGNNNVVDFGARIYDARLGRWFCRDPLAYNYPTLSPYTAFGNNPIIFIDKIGADIVIYYKDKNSQTTPVLVIKTDAYKSSITLTYNQCMSYPGLNYALSNASTTTINSDEFSKAIEEFSDMVNTWDAWTMSAGATLALGPGVGVSFNFVGINVGADAGGMFSYVTLSSGFGAMAGVGLVGGSVDVSSNYLNVFDRSSMAGQSFTDSWNILFLGHSTTTSYDNPGADCFFGGCDDPVIYSTDEVALGGGAKLGWAHTNNNTWLIGTVVKPEKDTGYQEYPNQENINYTYMSTDDSETTYNTYDYGTTSY